MATTTHAPAVMSSGRASAIAGTLVGSEILKIAADVRALVASGRDICNLTVGDFSSSEFRIPDVLERGIVEALKRGETNYPPSDGILPLREAVRSLYRRELGFTPDVASVIITAGPRARMFGTSPTPCGPGHRLAYPPPPWHHHYLLHHSAAHGRSVPNVPSAA